MAEGHRVTLNVYDLSQGLARELSTTLLGKPIEAIWHTGVAVYGNEYYFGGGIQHSPAGLTPYGTPVRVVELGVTHVPPEVFESYLQEISPRYTAETYSLLAHNCNNFSNEVAQFLAGTSIPDYILNLPKEVMNSPVGALIMPMIQQLEATLRAGAVPHAPQFAPSSLGPAVQRATTNADNPNGSANRTEPKEQHSKKEEAAKAVSRAVAPAGTQEDNGVPGDPLGSARIKLQEEISKEFAALMATGSLRASEAAALATRKLTERYGVTTSSSLSLIFFQRSVGLGRLKNSSHLP